MALYTAIVSLPATTIPVESDPSSLVTIQMYVPATPLGTVSLTVSTLEYVEEVPSVTV